MKQNCLTNLIQLYEFIEQNTSNSIDKSNDFKAILCPRSSWPNMIYDWDVVSLNLASTIEAIQGRIVKKELPPYCMFDRRFISDEKLQELISLATENRYWDYMEYHLEKPVQLPELPEFEIKQVSDIKELAVWVEVMNESIMKGKQLDFELFKALLPFAEVEYYVGYEKGIPVAGSMLFKKDEIAGVYMIGTLEKFQRKGYGSAVTQYVLKRGFELNCKKAVLQATQAGEKIYSKLGFTIEGRIELFNLQLNQ